MFSPEDRNALVDTRGGPSDEVVFVMVAAEPEDLEESIRSRSQHFHFRALWSAEIVDALEKICVKEGLTAEPGALGVMARAAEGSLRDALSLLEQARAYCGTNITDTQVRELLGVVPEEILDELTGAIEAQSAERVLKLVHRLLAEGQNLQHFCREAIGHFRNLLVARVCGADSALIAAPADQRPRLKQTAESFSEEDLTRFFQILLHTDDDLRHKPDARLHLEIVLLRLVNAARLAPLEEILADLEGGAPERATSPASQMQAPARSSAPAALAATASPSLTQGVPQSSSAERMQTAAMERTGVRDEATVVSERATTGPVPSPPPSVIARTAEAGAGLEAAQVDSIKAAILGQEKFLGELIEHASRWEMSGGEVRLFFPTESRALAEMLQARDPMERLRNIASRILGQTVRVCVKLEAVPVMGAPTRSPSATRELRAKFEQDPIVRAMLERFGGQISDVKRRSAD